MYNCNVTDLMYINYVRQISFFDKPLTQKDVQSLFDNKGACTP